MKGLKKYSDPPKSSDMFYAGCALPHLFPELAKTSLLEIYPIVGGMKYCCGGYVLDSFGEEEAYTLNSLRLLILKRSPLLIISSKDTVAVSWNS